MEASANEISFERLAVTGVADGTELLSIYVLLLLEELLELLDEELELQEELL